MWTDICCDLKPLSKKKAQLQMLARKGASGWQSERSRATSYNRREDKGHLKIKQKNESRRVYWMPVLARGKLHIELLGSEFPGDKVEAMPEFVEKLKKAIKMRFPVRANSRALSLLTEAKASTKAMGRAPRSLTKRCGSTA